jgi:nicotinate-nucleotide adenylyltransferase
LEIKRIYNIALFGGTFDPFHMGHYELLDNLNKELHPDKIYVIPAGHPYFKENVGKKVSSAEDRIEMTRAGLKGLDIPWEISTVETDKDTPSYSIETIRYFRENGLPKDSDAGHLKIWFLCGSDLLFEIDKWYRYEEILSSVTLAVIPRGDDDMEEILSRKKVLEKEYDAKIYISGYRGRNISSTMIRENPEKYKELIPAGTYEYIRDHGLYGC